MAARPAAVPGVANVLPGLSDARRQLVAQRDWIGRQIAALDQALAAMGAAPPPRPVGRPPGRRAAAAAGPRAARRGRRREGSLKDFIGRVLKGRGPMAVKNITRSVLDAGYQTRNRTLAKSIGIALTQMPEVEKVGRGTFKMD